MKSRPMQQILLMIHIRGRSDLRCIMIAHNKYVGRPKMYCSAARVWRAGKYAQLDTSTDMKGF